MPEIKEKIPRSEKIYKKEKNNIHLLQKKYNWCIIFTLYGFFISESREPGMNKNILCLSRITCVLFILTALTVFLPAFVFSSGIEETGNISRLVTSNNPDYYSVIETNGDTFSARGTYKNDRPVSAGISGVRSSVQFHAESDGSYRAEISFKPPVSAYYDFYIHLESGVYLTYLMKYDNGWYFPDNGLETINAQRVEKASEAPDIAAAYYISVNADKNEIESTIDELKKIVEEVCGDEPDDYKKAYLLNRWIADNIYYDHDAAETSVTLETVAIHNVLEKRRTTCAGFANTYSALLELAGIRSLNLKGAAIAGEITYETLTTGGENHEFSAFWYEKQNRWVYADSCWSGAGDYEKGVTSERITYDKYFDISGSAFALNHRVDKAEERHYSKALDAVEKGDTQEPTSEPEDTISETTDNNVIPDNTFPPSTSNIKNNDDSDKGEKSIVPLIIGLAGILIIGAGVIIAVNNNKKQKKERTKK